MNSTVKQNFIDYLEVQGCEVLPVTNSYESVRFKAGSETCVIYEKKDGRISFGSKYATDIFNAFINNRGFIKKNPSRNNTKRLKRSIIQRDGNRCFYTGVEMTEEEMTLEHLVPISKGGVNNLHNLVLCTKESNAKMGDKLLVDKIKFREANLFKTSVDIVQISSNFKVVLEDWQSEDSAISV